MTDGGTPYDLRLPASANEEEAAAIAAAIDAHLAGERGIEDGDQEDPSWAGRRWRLAGRLAALDEPSRRAPRGAPVGAWRAADRADRF